ncbi:hypothetical protein CRUP_023261 [Coryphaenoides rupestris]|nr:hypothetical protein CRUP_023261 [Coryphaenoides rupestris]
MASDSDMRFRPLGVSSPLVSTSSLLPRNAHWFHTGLLTTQAAFEVRFLSSNTGGLVKDLLLFRVHLFYLLHLFIFLLLRDGVVRKFCGTANGFNDTAVLQHLLHHHHLSSSSSSSSSTTSTCQSGAMAASLAVGECTSTAAWIWQARGGSSSRPLSRTCSDRSSERQTISWAVAVGGPSAMVSRWSRSPPFVWEGRKSSLVKEKKDFPGHIPVILSKNRLGGIPVLEQMNEFRSTPDKGLI